MTKDELREAVARAMCEADGFDPDHVPPEYPTAAPRWFSYQGSADAALRVVREALREPTVEMIEAWRQTWATSNPKIEWRAMLAASPMGGGDE